MNTLDLVMVFSLIASIAGIIISVLAVWLSIVFYRLSTKASERTDAASNDIQRGVERLEQLFDRLYSDTFSIVRDTVSDMRQHMWSGQTGQTESESQAKEKTEKRLDELKIQMEKELSKLLEKQGTGVRADAAAQDMRPLINRAISEATRIAEEVEQETLAQNLRKVIAAYAAQEGEGFATASALIRRVQAEYPEYGFVEILKGLRGLRGEGLLDWRGDELAPSTTVKILGK